MVQLKSSVLAPNTVPKHTNLGSLKAESFRMKPNQKNGLNTKNSLAATVRRNCLFQQVLVDNEQFPKFLHKLAM